MGRGPGRDWRSEPLNDSSFRAPAATGPLSRQLAPAALQAARRVRPVVWRLSSRREYPQLELHVALPDPRRDDASQFFTALRALAEQMAAET